MPLLGAVVAFLPTPRTPQGEVGAEALAALADRAVRTGVDGIALLGSTGGFAYLDRRRRRQVVETAVGTVDGRVPVLAGVGALTTEGVLGYVDDAQRAGADALLLPTTSYLPLTAREAVELYRAAGAAADRPVWAYHNPSATRVELDLATLATIAALPGIGGIKDRGSDRDDVRARARWLLDHVPAGVEVGFSGDAHAYQALLVGARTWHSGLASVLPGPCVALARAAGARDEAAAAAAAALLAPVISLVDAHGGPRVLHLAGEILGLHTGALPAPLLVPGPQVRADLERALADLAAQVPLAG